MLSKYVSALAMCGLLVLSPFTYADLSSVPKPDNLDIRMQLDDEYPMILTGFVRLNAQQVLNFYFDKLGDPTNMVEEIGRQTLFFKQSNETIKISVYQQNDWTEISIMVTQ
ncbi:hypothetical protein [Pseudoalteromonas tunicata]|jgi:hypothetical protein|uniref:Orphan protein n=1 Tax=Pseudoalteromonas tunicata D2 TaxID=87626 RepID=A4CCZ5_9GAMM|nr:hypothetical protein [Pseudoalteromonas tunicata]ATC93944.1 hypothetical protein PTUN_a1297 [Pseudoalteromonas tunicata]AXT29733.1 hypothetical protein D1819_02105 [Pseudoalteromonas tunicata]EAR27438.1 hypothetical protein PTD2_15402 [Pseudoalteromonas tunicata D2]